MGEGDCVGGVTGYVVGCLGEEQGGSPSLGSLTDEGFAFFEVVEQRVGGAELANCLVDD